MNPKMVLPVAVWLPVLMVPCACRQKMPEGAPTVDEARPVPGGEEAEAGEEKASSSLSVDQDRPAVTVKVKAPTPAAPDKAAPPVVHALPAWKPEVEKKAAPTPIPESGPKNAFDTCMKLCGEQNMMRAVAWEVIEADCRAECKGK